MFGIKKFKIRSYEIGLLFRDGEFSGVLSEGLYLRFDPWNKIKVEIVSRRSPWLVHEKNDVIARSGLLGELATVIELNDHQRGLVWIDGRFDRILPPGQHIYWNGFKEVRVEIADIRGVRFDHPQLQVIVRVPVARAFLEVISVNRQHEGVLFQDGRLAGVLPAGQYVFWKGAADVRIVEVDMRETSADISGQEIMTADKVTLRMNAVVSYRVADAGKSVTSSDDARQSLYRETQLALRAVIGARELDAFLTDKDAVSRELTDAVRRRAGELGLEVASAGIRDVILPGEMKDLMNKVTEAKKAAEANLIVRREETAAIRSQANTAKLLADNPTLMRLRELEVLEKVASAGHLNVVLGEKGLADRVVNLL